MTPSATRILAWLERGNTGHVSEIARVLRMKLPTVYKSLRQLSEAKKVEIAEVRPIHAPSSQTCHVYAATAPGIVRHECDDNEPITRLHKPVGTWERQNASAGMLAPASWCGVLS